MNYFEITGAVTAKDFIQNAIQNEYQFEVRNEAGRKLLIVFYKGTWAVQDPLSRDFVQMYDAPLVPDDGVHTIGLCDGDHMNKGNPVWVGFCKQRLGSSERSFNGVVVTKNAVDLPYNPMRSWPAEILTDLIFMVLGDVLAIHVVQTSRNGSIKNGTIMI